MVNVVENLLTEGNLRVTQPRKLIMQVLCASEAALSQADIERALDSQVDRVTVYRTLKSFEEAGIIHKISDTDSVAKYALCLDECSKGSAHSHNHAHFHCNACGNTTCLNSVHIDVPDLPKGYLVSETNLIVSGLCTACLGKASAN
jgi:Fur family ferric uptake transcriptional regulator